MKDNYASKQAFGEEFNMEDYVYMIARFTRAWPEYHISLLLSFSNVKKDFDLVETGTSL